MRPLNFMIVGAQKSGTTALAEFLDEHEQVCMSSVKECHLFDSPEFSSLSSIDDINRLYEPYFSSTEDDCLRGEATPVYMFYSDVPAQLARYNPDLKLIVVLREPAERAISHYVMERERGQEALSLVRALLAEPLRIRQGDPRAWDSAYRIHSYRARGMYAGQIKNLYRSFPRDQVLLLNQQHLLNDHHATLSRVFQFLGVDADQSIQPRIVFSNESTINTDGVLGVLRKSYSSEYRRLREIDSEMLDGWFD